MDYFVTIRKDGYVKRHCFTESARATAIYEQLAKQNFEESMARQISVRISFEDETRVLKTVYINSEL